MADLQARMTERLAALRRETEVGEDRLRALENEIVVLRQTLLRIDGATQVLRELLDGAVRLDDAPAAEAG